MRPVTPKQIKAAIRLHNHMRRWKRIDEQIEKLNCAFPGYGYSECFWKLSAIGFHYGINRVNFLVPDMANRLAQIMTSTDKTDPSLVDTIASSIDPDRSQQVSLAAKFCHLFVDRDVYRMWDNKADHAVRLHYRPARRPPGTKYQQFCIMADAVMPEGTSLKHADVYLWIRGNLELRKPNGAVKEVTCRRPRDVQLLRGEI